MSSLFARRDVIVVASVSCIYGIGSKEDYEADGDSGARRAGHLARTIPLAAWWTCNTTATTSTFERGQFRVRGDTVELCPAGREDALRVEFFGDEIERITRFEPLTGEKLETPANTMIFPGETIRHHERQDEARHPLDPRGTGRAHRGV